MAATKLTLSIEPDVIEKAKRYAKEKHISLSRLVQDYLKDVAVSELDENDPLAEMIRNTVIPDNIKRLTGILKGKVPDDVNLWDEKYEYLKEKYDL